MVDVAAPVSLVVEASKVGGLNDNQSNIDAMNNQKQFIPDAMDAMDAIDAADFIVGLEEAPVHDAVTARHDDDFDSFVDGKIQCLEASNHGKLVTVGVTLATENDNDKTEGQKTGITGKDPMLATTAPESSTTTTPTPETTTTATATPESATAAKKRYVSSKDFELLKVIGMGAFGKVLQVRNKTSKQILAMKVISKRLLRKKAGYIENIQAERNILTKVKHPFVVTMHCSFQNKEKLFIIMDFLAGGELFLRLGREGIFLEKTAAFYLGEIILALDHLHSLNILHRDLKPENILLCNDGHVCVTDFGLAKEFNSPFTDDDTQFATTICGTQEYMAPEMVARQGYTRAADYWSLGCIAYEMLAGLPPFHSKKGSKDLFNKIMTERVKMPHGATASACKLLKGLLTRNKQQRLGAAKSTMFEVGGITALKQAPFFEYINWEWEKLEKKEITPPYIASVQNEEDLKHFHDEFTKMPLPRSVVESSLDHFLPKHCESQNFRGFSFIHDDFLLPERKDDEIEHYFNNIDEDGESVSECASSKIDGDEKEQSQVEPPMASVPEAKKRPPRKRNKKKNGVAAVGSPTVNGTNKAPASVTASSADDDAAETQSLTQEKNDSNTSKLAEMALESNNQKGKNNNVHNKTDCKLATPTSKAATTAASTVAVTATASPIQKAANPNPNQHKFLTPPSVKKHVEPTWQSASNGKMQNQRMAQQSQQQPLLKPGGANHLQNVGHIRQQQRPKLQPTAAAIGQSSPIWKAKPSWGTPTPTKTQNSSPAPGSWAAKIQNNAPAARPGSANAYGRSTPSASRNDNNGFTPRSATRPTAAITPTYTNNNMNVPASPVAPSTDWRDHSYSSPGKVKRVTEISVWPSLGEFPPPPTTGAAGPGNGQATTMVKPKPPPKGAWAAKGAWAVKSGR